jgi:hypothetical protein
MQPKMLIKLFVAFHLTFFVIILFTAPNPTAHLRFALDDLGGGPIGEDSTQILDARSRVSAAIVGYEFQTTLTLGFALAGIGVSSLVLLLVRRQEQSAGKAAGRD